MNIPAKLEELEKRIEKLEGKKEKIAKPEKEEPKKG